MPRGQYRRARPQEAVQTIERPELRPEIPRPELEPRPDLRAASSRDASARAAEILGHVDFEEGQDEFYIDKDIIPPGWSYEWKRHTIAGKEDPSYQVQLARTGWEPVPAKRHPEFMPSNYRGQEIERKGMILMERPKEITQKVEDIERRKATGQIRQKQEQLNAAPPGQFARVDGEGRPTAKVRQAYEAIPIPE